MSWKRYQNELIVLATFVIMLGAYAYKHTQVTSQAEAVQSTQKALDELKEVIALKKVWANKKTSKKLSALQSLVPASKVKWSKKGKKVTATYTGLSSNELNKLTTKILNLPVEINLLNIEKTGSTYHVEFKCKW
ncbi:MAG TPA: hypothetical protein ENK98_06265 [Epsilonproteobacteria bacterium]|nr:hypothetical protein [Campylobacterota bacterium]